MSPAPGLMYKRCKQESKKEKEKKTFSTHKLVCLKEEHMVRMSASHIPQNMSSHIFLEQFGLI